MVTTPLPLVQRTTCATASLWQEQMSRARALDEDNPRKWELTEQFADALGAEFLQEHQCVQKRADRMFELRGRFHDYPARLLAGDSSALRAERLLADVQASGLRLFQLRFDVLPKNFCKTCPSSGCSACPTWPTPVYN
jgi:hypothetical protein